MSWHPYARHVREERLGLTAARLRGVSEAIADILVFVDDDNVLDANYLSEAIRIGREWPILGAWGSGATIPEFEVEPPDHLREFVDLLALQSVNEPRWSNVVPCVGARPWGAGQCIRAAVASAYRRYLEKPGIKITDRRGDALLSGGDLEIGFVACTIGLGLGIFPELKLIHLIPKERINEDYLIRLAEGLETSAIVLQYKWENIYPKSPIAGPVGLARVLKNLVSRKGIHRRMYMAGLRAKFRARSIILENCNEREYGVLTTSSANETNGLDR